MLLVVGLAAGLAGGLLGIGGGIILMPVLRFALDLPPAQAAGTCVMAVFFTTLGGGFKHYRLGHAPLRFLYPVIVSGAVSTLLFSILFIYFAQKGYWLDFGIGMVFLLVSSRMIFDGIRLRNKEEAGEDSLEELNDSPARKVVLGGVAGLLPGLFGIGTGAILVPGFTYLLKTPIKVAIGSALVCFAVNAAISATMKTAQGYVDLALAFPLCAGTASGAWVGAIINRRTPSAALRLLFGLAFSGVALRFIWGALEAWK
ncbi:MAG TPA: sulfite exporter TauE/SafE family protein [bacterium]|nr:sulfite exporter TauE/SafE family protein [bacterium]